MQTDVFSNSTVDELSIRVGCLRVRMFAPQHREEPGSRISFWWGITSAAIALARYLEAGRSLQGQRVVELGCGLGLAGITAGLRGAEVLFTDYVPEALQFASMNAKANGLIEQAAGFALLDWEDPRNTEPFDIVCGSEILYDYFCHGSLIKLFPRLLKSGGRIILADRKRLAVSRFVGRMIDAGFRCAEKRSTVAVAGFPEQEISLFTVHRR